MLVRIPKTNKVIIRALLNQEAPDRFDIERAMVYANSLSLAQDFALYACNEIISECVDAAVLLAFNDSKKCLDEKTPVEMRDHIKSTRLIRALMKEKDKSETAHAVAHLAEAVVANTHSSAAGHSARSFEAACRVKIDLYQNGITYLLQMIDLRCEVI